MAYGNEDQQNSGLPEKSAYEAIIMDAYNNLGSQIDFSRYVSQDQWCIVHLPKSARNESKSGIRKILPGGKHDKHDPKSQGTKQNPTQKGGFFNRIRSGVNTLVNDPSNMILGKTPDYDIAYYDEEEDGVDTDDLHRYAQKLRELEDNDKEINPEFLVIRDGKTVYGVHETDAEGKLTLSKRKPIYDRVGDQTPDEGSEKRNLLARLRRPFTRNKDKDNKDIGSPKSGIGTADNGKAKLRKSTKKTASDDMAATNNDELVMD